MTNPNVLELAGRIGYAQYGDIGRNAFEEIELCYASRVAPKFSGDYAKIRSFINLNFYWTRSYFKNMITEDFQKCLPDSFANRKVTTATKETMFGSISEDKSKLYEPLFWGYELCFIPELSAFLDSKDYKEKVNVFNEVLEQKKTTRDLKSFADADDDLITKYTSGVNGLYFNGRTLSYEPNTAFVVCTRPLDNKMYTYLEHSGFWSRFHTIQFKITDSTASDIFTGAMRGAEAVDVESLMRELKAYNESLFAKRSDLSAEVPDYDNVLLPILSKALALVKERACEPKYQEIALPEILNVRVKGDIIREVRAYKLLRPDVSNEELKNWGLARVEHFFDFAMQPIIAREFTSVPASTAAMCLHEIKQLTEAHALRRDEIVEAMQKKGYSTSTIGRALKLLTDSNLNKSKDYGVYET